MELIQSVFEKLNIKKRVERFDEVIDSDKLKNEFNSDEFSKTDYCHYKIIETAKRKIK